MPRLILQPLVENAVKYAVGTSQAVVTIRIAGAADARRLTLSVDDDGPARGTGPAGLGIGLANVRDRLLMRYGGAASLTAGPRENGGYGARIELPYG